MTRLAVPIVIVLLMLFAGAVWLIAVNLDPELASKPASETSPAATGQQPSRADAPRSQDSSAETPPDGQADASFDVARIDPQGTSVFAGQAEPGSTVTILGDGQPVATAQADENGEWTVATDHPFASAEPKLALSVTSAAATNAAKDKAAEAKVAGSLETREPAKEEPKRQTADTVASNLLKNFEGIVAAARDEAEQEKKQAEEKKAESEAGPKTETKTETETTTTVPEPTVPEPEISKPEPSATEPKEKVAVADPPQAPSPPDTTPDVPPPTSSDTPADQSATPPSPPPAGRLAATGPETPPTPESKSIPVPITFVFNEATFTDDGRKAVALLLEYLQIKRFGRVSLTGHADERGTETLNMDLSRERLDAVAEFLKDGGFDGKLELIPKGEAEPFSGVDRDEYATEDLYQLDRRVELITAP